MGLKETYESWQFRPVRDVPAGNTPQVQAEGKITIPSASFEANYETFKFKPVGDLPAAATPQKQAAGEYAVNWLPNDVQTEIKNRAPGNKVVIQATADNKTNGQFKESILTNYYENLSNNPKFKSFKSRTIHTYNNKKPYIEQTQLQDTPGVLNISAQVSLGAGVGGATIRLTD